MLNFNGNSLGIEMEKSFLTFLFLSINDGIQNRRTESLLNSLSTFLYHLKNKRHLFTSSDPDFKDIVNYIQDIVVIIQSSDKPNRIAAWNRVNAWSVSGKPTFIIGNNLKVLSDIACS